jgi:DNA-binding XRE family transcriptional regulator
MTQGSLHEPTKLQRDTVKLHAMIGTPQEDIARVIGIDAKTLRLHYREELDLAIAMANATIGGALFNKAKGGDTAAMIFWMKTRAGWKEKTEIDLGLQEDNPINSLIAKVLGKTLDPQ